MHYGLHTAWQIATNLVLHEHTKHFEVAIHFVKEKTESKDIRVKQVHTDDQLAGFLTKVVPRRKLSHALSKLGIVGFSVFFNQQNEVETGLSKQ